MGKQTFRERIPAFASILGLLVLIAAYYIVGAVRDANVAYGLKAVINQSVVVALVATGAVFIYTLGGRSGGYHNPYDVCDQCGLEPYDGIVRLLIHSLDELR